jgi:hypothetical protein
MKREKACMLTMLILVFEQRSAQARRQRGPSVLAAPPADIDDDDEAPLATAEFIKCTMCYTHVIRASI